MKEWDTSDRRQMKDTTIETDSTTASIVITGEDAQQRAVGIVSAVADSFESNICTVEVRMSTEKTTLSLEASADDQGDSTTRSEDLELVDADAQEQESDSDPEPDPKQVTQTPVATVVGNDGRVGPREEPIPGGGSRKGEVHEPRVEEDREQREMTGGGSMNVIATFLKEHGSSRPVEVRDALTPPMAEGTVNGMLTKMYLRKLVDRDQEGDPRSPVRSEYYLTPFGESELERVGTATVEEWESQ